MGCGFQKGGASKQCPSDNEEMLDTWHSNRVGCGCCMWTIKPCEDESLLQFAITVAFVVRSDSPVETFITEFRVPRLA
jgi:hypothetical protein